jgi:hypothetical protein
MSLVVVIVRPQFQPRIDQQFAANESSFAPRRQSIKEALDTLDMLAVLNPQAFHAALNRMGISKIVARLEKDRAAKFFDPANLERVGKRYGKFDFTKQLADMTLNPTAYSRQQKLQMLQFISNAYNDHIGAPRTTVKLYKGSNPSQYGYFNNNGCIYVNETSAAFEKDFARLVNAVVHENTHNTQQNPNRYSNPILSRIYRANFHAYNRPEVHGAAAYILQPVEAGAMAAGYAAEGLVRAFALKKHEAANDRTFRPRRHRLGRPRALAA